jgi:hypothetical protein
VVYCCMYIYVCFMFIWSVNINEYFVLVIGMCVLCIVTVNITRTLLTRTYIADEK